MSWWERQDKEAWALRMSALTPEGWGPVREITRGEGFFVNWADFPSVTPTGEVLVAHWPLRGGKGTYDYSTQTATSRDGGVTWSDPVPLHDDGTPTEHGFVSLLPTPDEGLVAVWLDGRKHVIPADEDGDPATAGPEPTPVMTLRGRFWDPAAGWMEEALLDGMTCDCCQTDLVLTGSGPLAVYRDRTEDEIRDIYAVRATSRGWTEPRPVAADGWHIAGCPVNGPALAAQGGVVAVAWFTGAQERERVQVAFSYDDGATWGDPILVDDATPLGRVDMEFLEDGSVAVVWLARTGAGGEIRGRRVGGDGTVDPAWTLVQTSGARSSGFPQLRPAPDGDGFILAFTDPTGDASVVRVARVRMGVPTTTPSPE